MEREMTIARGLTRLKTIKAQLHSITDTFNSYSAYNNKKKHPLGDNKENVEKTHNKAQEEINSLYQQYNDLIKEYKCIKTAIDRTNMFTKVSISGEEMTIYEALLYKREVLDFKNGLLNSFKSSINKAQKDVENYNKQFVNANEELKKIVFADVSYLINKNKMDEVNKFIVEFITEIDGTLNEINALTKLMFD